MKWWYYITFKKLKKYMNWGRNKTNEKFIKILFYRRWNKSKKEELMNIKKFLKEIELFS